MDILYLLIPVSTLLLLAIVAIFGWAVHAGQFERLEEEGRRILDADADADAEARAAVAGVATDAGTAAPRRPAEGA
jgi:cbb3-type cytochrome oxidase maturation protein